MCAPMSDPRPQPRFVLDRTPPPAAGVPSLDPAQQRVVDHAGGPLLVLAGPGTGKTTTLVEAVVRRVEEGLSPDEVLVLTFSRKAADELRERITTRLGRTVREPSAWTFHSFCHALTTAYSASSQPRLLSGPERLVRIRELLRGAAEGEGNVTWPAELRVALGTRGLARELADLLDRARERGIDADRLAALAKQAGRADWAAAAQFFTEYVDVLGAAGEIDYGELVRQAVLLLDDADVVADLRGRYRAVFVDEYQDTDPAQEELLRRLAGDGRDLVVVGDPDQAIYAFRGADVTCLQRFPERFATATGEDAPTIALGTSRRAGSALLAASRAVARGIPTAGLKAADVRAHRDLVAAHGTAPGSIRVRLFSTVAEEATAIADVLRRAHLEDGIPWREMAVLVRSGKRSVPTLRRALVAAGVPLATASDELPVASDPAVGPLLLALRCAADPDALDSVAARTLLTSPLVRATPADLRRLGRALRQLDRDRLSVGEQPDPLALPRPSADLVRDTVHTPGDLILLDERDARVGRPVERLARLLTAARNALDSGAGAEQALWEIWNGSGWPGRLLRDSLAGGSVGRSADRDLDAVVALFDAVARFEERRPRAGVTALLGELEAQEIPSENRREGVLAGAGAVRLLTAHRAKGLEWELVVVAGVQEGVWPDVRRRSSLLAADRLGADGEIEPLTPGRLLADERRLFYVAVTRAKRRLVVTAVRSLDDDGDRPSRFLDELGDDVVVPEVNERAAGALSAHSLVARLRHVTLDSRTDDVARAEAAALLAALAATGPDGQPLVAAAHPDTWWGLADWTPGAVPVRPQGEPVALSGSAVSGYHECPLAWFLEREARAVRPASVAQGFGLVVHVLARLVATGHLEPTEQAMLDRLGKVWDSLAFDAAWQRDREHAEAARALRRLLRWLANRPDRTYVASEVPFTVDYADTVLRGSIDRVERDADGGIHVIDFKTSKQAPRQTDVDTHAQLGVYQIAVREGGLGDLADGGDPPVLGGAELVQLRDGTADGNPKVQAQKALPDAADPDWADELVRRTAAGIVAEQFPARVNERCDRCVYARVCPAQDEGKQVIA
jgi:superfamily I DNA/RNA helicase